MGYNDKHGETASPALHTTSTGRSGMLEDPTPSSETSESDRQPAGTLADKSEINAIPRPSVLSTQSPVHLVLGNFFFATSSISLIVFTIFFAVTWFTVLQDARSMNDWVLSNVTGVSLCLYHDERVSLMTDVAVGVDTRPQPSTGPRCMRTIYFMETRCLWCGHHI